MEVSQVKKEWSADQAIVIPTAMDGFRPYPHQTAAWDAMTRHYRSHHEGMLVVPTGGGKTAIAARWLLRHRVSQGWRVLWLTHRRSLLRQAAESFFAAAGECQPKQHLHRIVISSTDMSWSNVSRSHDLVFSSVQSAVTEHSSGFVDLMATQSPQGLFVVVDEAHHAASPSYQRLLKKLHELKCPVLGLSATPVRIQEDDQRRLWNVFRKIIYQVPKQTLINQGILAAPTPETVQTKIEFEREFTESDVQHLEKFGELGSAVLSRIAKHSARNHLIVEHYRKHREKYGKTLVFGVDVLHAQTLTKEFLDQGIAADYVDYTRGDSEQVVAAYRDGEEPMVLANVEMLTEGVDLPRTKTVFIVRPTRSEALLSQMIGRALRGPYAGGTDEAHLVTFVDTWKDFSVLDAEYVVAAGNVPDDGPTGRPSQELVPIERELILEAYKLVRSNVRGDFTGVFACLPHKWFVWEAEFNDDIQTRHVMVFENQSEGFDDLLRAFADPATIPETITEVRARDWVATYFGDIQDPLPSWIDIMELLDARRRGVQVGEYTFTEKRAFNPRDLAREIWNADLGERAKLARLQEIFDGNQICQLVYRGDFNSFREDVQGELDELAGRPKPPPLTVREAIPTVLRPWPEGNAGYQLAEICREVTDAPAHFPAGAPSVRDIRYMSKPSHCTYGIYRYSSNIIKINPALNSPDVPRFVMEYLVYHELLHADMPSAGHDRNFRRRERRFTPTERAIEEARSAGFTPPAVEDGWRLLGDQFLDTLRLPGASARGSM